VILEIPSNLALHRVGARRWMARIMVSWGIAAMACALAWNAGSLLTARIRDRRVWCMALVYMCVNAAGYGTIFFLADIVERIGELSDFEVGLISAIPFSFGTVGLLVLGRLSDGARDRRLVLAAGMALGAAGLVGTAVLPPVPAIGAGAVATFGLLGAIPAFWGIPAALLSGRAAAGGIALVNSIGVTGGLIGPVLMRRAPPKRGSPLRPEASCDYCVVCSQACLAVSTAGPLTPLSSMILRQTSLAASRTDSSSPSAAFSQISSRSLLTSSDSCGAEFTLVLQDSTACWTA
jgi:hypothetical protein